MTPDDVPVFKLMTAALHRQSERHESAMRQMRTERDEARAEVVRLCADRIDLRQQLAEAAAERDELRAAIGRVATVKVWANEDGKEFLFADDVRAALGSGA